MLPVLNLGPLSLPVPELVLLLGFFLGSVLAERQAKASWKDSAFLEQLLWTSLVAGILGARLSYFARHPGAFSGTYLSLLSPNLNLFDMPGGILIALSVSAYLISRQKLAALFILDRLTPFFAVLAGSVHLSRFAAGSGFGKPSDLPWAITLWGANRHPVQLYYLLASLIVLALGLILQGKYAYAQGALFLRFSLLTGIYLLFLSGFQEAPTSPLPWGIRPDQSLAWLVTLISLVLLPLITKRAEQENIP